MNDFFLKPGKSKRSILVMKKGGEAMSDFFLEPGKRIRRILVMKKRNRQQPAKPGKSKVRIPGVQKEGEVRSTSFFHARTAVTKSNKDWIDTPTCTSKPELTFMSVIRVHKNVGFVLFPTVQQRC